MSVTAFDPVGGKGKLLRTINTENYERYSHSLSPDGSTFAIAVGDRPETRIRLLSLTGSPDREIAVKGRSNLESLEWSADGKALYCGSISSSRRHAPVCGS